MSEHDASGVTVDEAVKVLQDEIGRLRGSYLLLEKARAKEAEAWQEERKRYADALATSQAEVERLTPPEPAEEPLEGVVEARPGRTRRTGS